MKQKKHLYLLKQKHRKMEFKETKGNKDEKFKYAFNMLYPNWDDRDVIGQYEQNAVKGFHVGYNQALIDSKAPEMLELLITLVKNDSISNRNQLKEAINLIQQATEI